ncbi:MAG: hypothetical protein AB7I59_03615 [Geminicoccaceae bacterium]
MDLRRLRHLLPLAREKHVAARSRPASGAGERIQDWWSNAYRHPGDGDLARRFTEEALATFRSVPVSADLKAAGLGSPTVKAGPGWTGETGPTADLAEVFAAMRYQRLRLRQDQNLPEWEGVVS